MTAQKIIILLILLLAALPSSAWPVEIRQEQYHFQMELTRNISGTTFVLGDFPAPAPIRPPAATPVAESPKPALAIRVGDSPALQQTASQPISQPASGPKANCKIPAVLFARGSAELTQPAGQTLLASLADCVEKSTPLAVTGYTCDLNTQELNDTLARKRAETMAELLRRHGFNVAAVTGKGKSDYKTTDPEKRYLNRRVEITTVNDPPRQP